jgi:hypothetical protein
MATRKQSTAKGSDSPLQPAHATPNAPLERLAVFIEEWNIEISAMSFHPDPSGVEHGHGSFDWLEGGAFLIPRSEVSATDWPRSTAMIAPDDAVDAYGMLYFDSHGISRIYKMTLSGGIWTIWRDFPGFSQRFLGTFSDDGNIITARWEKCSNGSKWEHDFDLKYTKVSSQGF